MGSEQFMANILNKIFDFNKKEVKKLEKIADKVEAFAGQMEALSDDALKAKTEEFKERYAKGRNGRSIITRSVCSCA